MENYNIQLIRSRRKSIALEIRSDLQIIVRAPLRMSKASIDKFVQEKAAWSETNLKKMQEKQAQKKATDGESSLTPTQLQELAKEACTVIPQRVAHFAPLVGVSYGRITIRNQKTRWGSCSAKGNLNFNCLLLKMPEAVLDYVVVHELCHRKEMNHSARFWAEVEKVLPDYKERRQWLKENGSRIMKPVPF